LESFACTALIGSSSAEAAGGGLRHLRQLCTAHQPL